MHDSPTPSQILTVSHILFHILAHVQCYMDHSRRDYVQPSIVVISFTVFSIMSICRIAGRCANA